MENDPANIFNKKIFSKMFESEDESNENIYKNTLLEFGDDTEKKEVSDANIKEFTHDSLLKRISLEDYHLFPPKNESLLIFEEGNLIEKEEPEKLFENEVDFLQKINMMNYLTFSPFSENFFPNKFKNKNTIEKNYESDNLNNSEDNSGPNKDEEKILEILDFDYDNYEINNDLLFNISMGFIDMNKLKKENSVSSDVFESKTQRLNKEKKRSRMLNKMKSENLDKNEIKYEVKFKEDLYESLKSLALKYENVEFFNKTITEFNKSMKRLFKIEKNSEKNRILLKWEKEFKEQQIQYIFYTQKKERMQRNQIKLKKEMEIKKNKEFLQKFEQEKQLENVLNKLRRKGKQRNSMILSRKYASKSIDSSTSNHKKKNSIDIKPVDKKTSKAKRIKSVSIRNDQISKTSRIIWAKPKNGYAFENI